MPNDREKPLRLTIPRISSNLKFKEFTNRAWLFLEYCIFEQKLKQIKTYSYINEREEEQHNTEIVQALQVHLRRIADANGLIYTDEIRARRSGNGSIRRLGDVIIHDWPYIIRWYYKYSMDVPKSVFEKRMKHASNYSFYLNVYEFGDAPDYLRTACYPEEDKTVLLREMVAHAKAKKCKLTEENKALDESNQIIHKKLQRLSKQRLYNFQSNIKALENIRSDIQKIISDCVIIASRSTFLKNIEINEEIKPYQIRDIERKLLHKIKKFEKAASIVMHQQIDRSYPLLYDYDIYKSWRESPLGLVKDPQIEYSTSARRWEQIKQFIPKKNPIPPRYKTLLNNCDHLYASMKCHANLCYQMKNEFNGYLSFFKEKEKAKIVRHLTNELCNINRSIEKIKTACVSYTDNPINNANLLRYGYEYEPHQKHSTTSTRKESKEDL